MFHGLTQCAWSQACSTVHSHSNSHWCRPCVVSVPLLSWLSGRCPLLLQIWLSQFQTCKWWTHHCETCHHWRDEYHWHWRVTHEFIHVCTHAHLHTHRSTCMSNHLYTCFADSLVHDHQRCLAVLLVLHFSHHLQQGVNWGTGSPQGGHLVLGWNDPRDVIQS